MSFMCSVEDEKKIKKIVEGVITDRDNLLFWRLLKWLGIPLSLVVFALGGAWVQILDNTDFRKKGGQFTQTQQASYAQEIDRRFEEQQQQIVQLREDYLSGQRDLSQDIDRVLEILLR